MEGEKIPPYVSSLEGANLDPYGVELTKCLHLYFSYEVASVLLPLTRKHRLLGTKGGLLG